MEVRDAEEAEEVEVVEEEILRRKCTLKMLIARMLQESFHLRNGIKLVTRATAMSTKSAALRTSDLEEADAAMMRGNVVGGKEDDGGISEMSKKWALIPSKKKKKMMSSRMILPAILP